MVSSYRDFKAVTRKLENEEGYIMGKNLEIISEYTFKKLPTLILIAGEGHGNISNTVNASSVIPKSIKQGATSFNGYEVLIAETYLHKIYNVEGFLKGLDSLLENLNNGTK